MREHGALNRVLLIYEESLRRLRSKEDFRPELLNQSALIVRNFIESYRIAARTTRVLTKGALLEKDLVARALRVGEQMFLGGEIERSEAVSRPTLENAFAAFVEQGYLQRREGKLALADSFASDEAAETIEARVASYLSPQ